MKKQRTDLPKPSVIADMWVREAAGNQRRKFTVGDMAENLDLHKDPLGFQRCRAAISVLLSKDKIERLERGTFRMITQRPRNRRKSRSEK